MGENNKKMSSTTEEQFAIEQIIVDRTQLLGRGSFGIVYKGTFRNDEVAVKVIPTHLMEGSATDAEVKALLFCREEAHKNIIRCYEVQRGPEVIQIVFELCRANLKQWIISKKSCILPAVINELQVTIELADGVKYLHSKRIIHRDLKPENILFQVSSEEMATIKIADFGLSKFIQNEQASFTNTRAAGTPGWAAPEILEELVNQEDHAGGM